MPKLVRIEIPIATPNPGAPRTRHLNLQLDTRQANGLRAVYDGFAGADVRLASGKRIYVAVDVIRFLLERIASAIDDDQAGAAVDAPTERA